MSITPLAQAPVLRDQVYEALEELVITGVLAPGERLVEADLARQLRVSRNPVREALSLLARERWVDLKPRHGAYVHEPTRKEVEDFFRVRTLLEAEAASLAAVNATPTGVEELRRRYEEGLEALAADDDLRIERANTAFHGQVMELADNGILQEVLGRLKKRLRWYFSRVVRARGASSWEEHLVLLEAIERGDAAAAADVMRQHCQATAAMYRSAVAKDERR